MKKLYDKLEKLSWRVLNTGLYSRIIPHYLAFIKRERYVEVGILISPIVLEVLTKNNKKIKDSNENKFASDLKKLIKQLNLDLNKLDKFFKDGVLDFFMW